MFDRAQQTPRLDVMATRAAHPPAIHRDQPPGGSDRLGSRDRPATDGEVQLIAVQSERDIPEEKDTPMGQNRGQTMGISIETRRSLRSQWPAAKGTYTAPFGALTSWSSSVPPGVRAAPLLCVGTRQNGVRVRVISCGAPSSM
ncbi:hypothetical protein [Streptomyces sp. NPDC054765]